MREQDSRVYSELGGNADHHDIVIEIVKWDLHLSRAYATRSKVSQLFDSHDGLQALVMGCWNTEKLNIIRRLSELFRVLQ